MIITNTPIEDIEKAVEEINKKYDNNLKFDPFLNCSYLTIIRFKGILLIKDFNKKGARMGFMETKSKFACFHAHYDFFNTLLGINPNAVICVCGDWIIKKSPTGKITGNWNKIDKRYISRPEPSSFICRCK